MRGALAMGRIVLPPIAHRLGTGFAVYLVAQGIPDDLIERLLLAAAAMGGVGLDMLTHFISRRK